jgi:hypothetical protein
VKQRLTVVEYVRQHGIKPTSRQGGWPGPPSGRNWRRASIQGLVPQCPARRRRRISEDVVALITQAHVEQEAGTSRTRIWLQRVHQVRVSLGARPPSVSLDARADRLGSVRPLVAP